MVRPFFQATAEQVVIVSEAVVALNGGDVLSIAAFTDLPQGTVESALKLAKDIGLLSDNAGQYSVASPLCKLLRTPQDGEKAAILRVTIESYEPFLVFREELEATSSVTTAAQRTKAKLDLDCHREQVKETLLSLATYAGALTAGQGNTYERDARGLTTLLDELAAGSREVAEAIHTIRQELGHDAAALVDHDQVISPMAAGLRHAAAGSGREAILQAGIAIENFLTSVAALHGTNIVGANGVNAKMDRLVQAGHYPGKLLNVCKYLGHLRNAADHGADGEIGAPWSISPQSGRNYIFVAAVFVRSMISRRLGGHEI
ncbi:hypothetical protein [Ensifer sp.]|uniref:hypothetical protein n=1 Tax=Ensifer sp. TaxID=1872086 RepID=UPI002899CCAB|nr:hypothetical protein [Ensifer sp.]